MPSSRARTRAELDAADPLAPFLDRFAPAPPGLIYLDGNSLGRLPKDTPSAGLSSMISGTPPVLGLTAASIGIELVIEAGIERIREKSTRLTEYAIALAQEMKDIGIGSPRDPATRGSHVALTHPQAKAVTAKLKQHDVIVDYREPDVIRLGLSPLTTRFADIDRAQQTLQSVSRNPKRDSSPSW